MPFVKKKLQTRLLAADRCGRVGLPHHRAQLRSKPLAEVLLGLGCPELNFAENQLLHFDESPSK